MANHCVDVICSKCGVVYCLRGCGTNFTEDKPFLDEWLKNTPKPFIMTSEEHCKGNPLYSYY